MQKICTLVLATTSLTAAPFAEGVESFSAVCTQTDGKRYQHLYYENAEKAGKDLRDEVAKDNKWMDEKLFVTNPVAIRYVSGGPTVLVDERLPFRVVSNDETKMAFMQMIDDKDSFNQNTYLIDLKSMKATYTRLRIYRGSLPGIMASQFSLDCKVSLRP